MARSRRWLDDIAYSEEHRRRLRELYVRVGHRLDVADRDWTEFCHHCKEPLAIIEQVRDVGQDIADKATTVTRLLAARAGVRAWLMAWRVERPAHVQAEIDGLAAAVMRLQTLYPITQFQLMSIYPGERHTPHRLDPAAYWQHILLIHRNHHHACRQAKRNGEHPVDSALLERVKTRSRLWLPIQTSFNGGNR